MLKTLFVLILGIHMSCIKKPVILYVSALTGTELLETNPDESKNYHPIYYLPLNSSVEIELSEKSYLKANFEGKSGWIEKSKLYLREIELYKYINSINLVKIYSEPDDLSLEIGILKNNYGIKILSSYKEDFTKYDSKIWFKIYYKNRVGWIKQSQVGDSKIQSYFFVNSYTGLNLRKEPNVNAKVLITIPFEGNGIINYRDSIEYIIQNQKGFWMNVNYRNQTGWVFSGFTLIGSDLEELRNGIEANSEKYFKEYLNNEYSLKELNILEFQDFIKSFKINKIDLDNYEIYELTMPNKNECDEDFKERLIFKNKDKNVYSLIDIGKSESIIKLNFPFQNSITTEIHMCYCCCTWMIRQTYFLMKDKIKALALDTFPVSNFGNCIDGSTREIEWGQSFKRKSDRELLGKLFYPNCDFDSNQNRESKGIIPADGYRHTLQLKIIFSPENNLLEINKIYDKNPSPDFEQLWNQPDLQIIKPD